MIVLLSINYKKNPKKQDIERLPYRYVLLNQLNLKIEKNE